MTTHEEKSSDETAATLQRILRAVERDERRRWVELACAIVLSLATTMSAWCAYQATLWSGVQTFRLAAAGKAGRDATAASLTAVQARAFDGTMLISYVEARSRGDKEMEKLLYERFRPEAKAGLDAWLATDPFNNPAAPPNPFKMAEYVQPELLEAKQKNELAEQAYAGAQHANKTSDAYVLLTVLFASVLFFGGIGGMFDSVRLQNSALVISIVLMTITLVALVSMPICRE